MVNALFNAMSRRIRNPFILGVVNRHKALPDRETVLITLSDSAFDKAANLKAPKTGTIVAFPKEMAEHISLRRPFLIVCSPVNYRRDPDVRSGIVALPLMMDNVPKIRAA